MPGDDLNSVPHAVYRIYDAGDQLLYVGISWNVDRRMNAHEHKAPWVGEYDHETLTWYDTRGEALAAETEAIKSEQPTYNVTHNRPPSSHTIRTTVDLTPELHRALKRWAADTAATLDVPRLSLADVIRAMIRATTVDGVGAEAITAILKQTQ